MFDRVLTISGKPGLYRLVSSGRNMFIVETVDAVKKRMPVHSTNQVVMLDDVAIYTDTEEVPLRDVFARIYEKEGAVLPFDIKMATPEEMVEYFEGIMPDYDRERVHVSDIKKAVNWFNLLVAAGMTEFRLPEESEEQTEE